ncbi:MAG: hypothetical protein B6241_01610 [Spirochaetaceae bacterium 4572_59]|nr:MAG: hypothetical protein B6241_01610 [Spirochaetaceae bacterium 4572_59]
MTEPVSYSSIVLTEITRSFRKNGIKACDNISFSVKNGEILAIMGENGAGKSTLMHILSGFMKADRGSLVFPADPDQNHPSVGMIHQKPILAGNLNVWENIALGHPQKSLVVKPAELSSSIRRIQENYGLALDLSMKGWELTAAQIQRAELLECLLLDRKILIFDEPTASLSEQQAEELLLLLKRLKGEGRTILYITHKIKEAYHLADRIAVLRKGKLKMISPVGEISPEAVSEAMIGKGAEIPDMIRKAERKTFSEAVPVLELKNINYSHQGSIRLKDLSLQLHAGEILGIAGIRENGLACLEDLITGAVRPQSGKILLKGKMIPYLTPFRFRKHGISYIPADRLKRGASLDSTLGENLILLKRKLEGNAGSYKTKLIQWAKKLISKGEIEGQAEQKVRTLSGGNIQKMILVREMHEAPALLIISEPSWGLDFSSREKLHYQISNARSRDAAVLLLTTDIDEILILSDRIAVLTGGELSETAPAGQDWNRKTIGERMTGADRL